MWNINTIFQYKITLIEDVSIFSQWTCTVTSSNQYMCCKQLILKILSHKVGTLRCRHYRNNELVLMIVQPKNKATAMFHFLSVDGPNTL